MLTVLEGVVARVSGSSVTVMVGGFGLTASASKDTLASLSVGASAHLYTHLAIRENAVDLFAFPDPHARDFFELLLTVSGVGPRSALAIMGLAPWQTVAAALRRKDVAYLTAVAGIGKKTAEKIAVELSDKVPDTGALTHDGDAELLDTLVALGYAERDARTAIRGIPSTLTEKEERLKHALGKRS